MVDSPRESSVKDATGYLSEPIAIIGMGSRFPGAGDPDALWNAVAEKRDCTGDFSGGRSAQLDAFYSRAGQANRPPTSRGGFLPDVDLFDAAFFEIAPREARWMDPQQRLLLEVAWEALEDAGQPLEVISGSRTAVFAGIWTNDYEIHANANSQVTDFFNVTGGPTYAASGRIAYQFDLRGPDLSVHGACAASLVAVHLAVRSLRSGESSMALAGGVNLILRHEETQAMQQAGILAKNGRCKFGDASSDGIVRSEGVGIVVLKRLSDAQRDGDSILGLILGTDVTHSGRSGGSLTMPSGSGEQEAMRRALADAGVVPASIEYVEAHGTGSRAGDPVELAAIASVYGGADRSTKPCLVGSVKSNIGHAESAAGVAGLIKAVQALRYKQFPATLHVREPNSAIDWESAGIQLSREGSAWTKEDGSPRRAAVNGLALAGSNAHVILEEFIGTQRVEATTRPAFILPISAASEAALRQRATQMLGMLKLLEADAVVFEDICYTAAVRRSHLAERVAIVGANVEQVRERLEDFLSSELSLRDSSNHEKKVAFVFPGQGAQWIGMGRELLKAEPAFRSAMEACDRAIQNEAGWSVLEQLEDASPDGRWTRIDVIQPVLFSIEVALAELWKYWGVEPSAVVGHSMGEIAAARIAGILSLEDAAAIICRRSSLMMSVAGSGAMAVVDLSQEEAEREIATVRDKVSVAVSNSARSTVLSGDPDAIDEVIERLEARDVFCRYVRVDVASHSPQMGPLKGALLEALRSVKPQAGNVPLYSTVHGKVLTGEEMNAAYWVDNLRETVQFAHSIETLVRQGFTTFVEMSPHPILVPFVEQTAALHGETALAVGSTQREASEMESMLTSLGQLYASGLHVDWRQLYPAGNIVKLPNYPWQRERFWIESSASEMGLQDETQEAVSEFDARTEDAKRGHERFIDRWKKLVAEERGGALKRWIQAETAAVLLARTDRVDTEKSFKSLGMNSLMTLKLRNRIEQGTGITLSSGMAWNYPTVTALAGHLHARLAVQEEIGQPEVDEPSRPEGISAADLLEAELAGAEVLLDRQNV